MPELSGGGEPFAEGQATLVLQGQVEAVQAQLRARLKVVAGEQEGEEYMLNRELTRLGRALENDIVLIDIASSRRHLELKRHAQGFSLRDLGSANGVSINGQRVLDDELYDGDVIEVGETRLRFEMVGSQRLRPDEREQDTDPGVTALPLPPELPTRARTRAATPPAPPAPPNTPVMSPVSQSPQLISPLPPPAPAIGFNAANESATREQRLPAPSPSLPLPFTAPVWGEEGEELIELEPIPEVPEEDLGGKPKPHNPWKTMGMEGLRAQDLGVQPAQTRVWWEDAIERALQLWDDFLLRTGLDRVPVKTRLIISLSLALSLVFGLFVGRMNQRSPAELSQEIRASVTRGELPQAEALLDDARDRLSPDELTPLEALIKREQAYAEARVAFKVAFSQKLWEEGLEIILTRLPQDDPEVIQLQQSNYISEVKQHVVKTTLDQAHLQMWRGLLKGAGEGLTKAQRLMRSPRFKLSDPALSLQMTRLSFALALHERRLKSTGDAIANPSPSEQNALERAASETREGRLKEAIKTLESAAPRSGPRRRIFELRIKAAQRLAQGARKKLSDKSSYAHRLKVECDPYLLAQDDDILRIFSVYFDAIRDAIKRGQYALVAEWMSLAELLSPENIQIIELRQRLEQQAQQWLKRAEQSRTQGKLSAAKSLLKAAIYFLPEAQALQAKSTLKSLP